MSETLDRERIEQVLEEIGERQDELINQVTNSEDEMNARYWTGKESGFAEAKLLLATAIEDASDEGGEQE